MSSKPITPEEVIDKKGERLPVEVFDAFNEMIADNFGGNEAVFKAKDVVALIQSKLQIGSSFQDFSKTFGGANSL
jgi:hypothetical protein